MKSEDNLLWIDLEMTGLDPVKNSIVEFACAITDKDLNIVAVGPDLPVKISKQQLESMDDWSRKYHTESGLIKVSEEKGVSIKKVEKMVLEFIEQHCVETKTIMAGIGLYRDRQFIDREMPFLSKFLHYRMLDVASLFQLQSRWYPSIQWEAANPAHRAMDDVMQSIEILKFFRKNIFK